MRCDNCHHEDNIAGVTLGFHRDDLTLRDTPAGVVLRLVGLKSGGEPGAPALPRTQVRIAVPAAHWPQQLRIEDEHWQTVVESGAFVAAAQPPRPGLPPARDPGAGREDEPDEGVHCAADCSCRAPRRVYRAPLTEGLPSPPVVPPDPAAYADAATNPPPPARAVRIETIGTAHVAVVEVAPVRLTAGGGIELCTSMKLSVQYTAEPPLDDKQAALADLRHRLGHDIDATRVIPLPDPVITSEAEAVRLHERASDLVLNSDVLARIDQPPVKMTRIRCEYLIITDDFRWHETIIAPVIFVPGVVAAFNRLAEAKRRRGVISRVVTITEIVNGVYGDFRTGSRDLPEVIRKFLKYARKRWGVAWLLLGGDTSIVPVRYVAGSVLGDIKLGTKPEPDDNTSYWTGDQLRMKVVGDPGAWWSPAVGDRLVNADTGQLIPYDPEGTSNEANAGWHFTEPDWTTHSAVVTKYVVVDGPEWLVCANLRFLYSVNSIPTDFYYASLAGWVVGYGGPTLEVDGSQFRIRYVYEPEHDWDALGNNVYGQHRADADATDLDGVHLATDLSVGRAPVESAAEAENFVDKVLAYEAVGDVNAILNDSAWPTRVVLASANWCSSIIFTWTIEAFPADGRYYHDARARHSLLKLNRPSDYNWDARVNDIELVAHVTELDHRRLPYKNNDDAAMRGWYYARSATDLRISEFSIQLPGMSPIHFPSPSEWIVVHGSLEDRTPELYRFDWIGPDMSMANQEWLRRQIRAELPAINTFTRLYEDEFDLALADRLAAPVEYLGAAGLAAALNARPHFVSLSGHGNPDGCCLATREMVSTLTNSRGFICYTDSCLTNAFDIDDVFGEVLMNCSTGGAVGYIGNTRFSWIDEGDDFQRAFFHRLATTRHLGLLNDSRIDVFGTTGAGAACEKWAIFSLNLLGDPELQVYQERLRGIRIVFDPPSEVIKIEIFPVAWSPTLEPQPLQGALVRVRSGDRVVELYADADGNARLPEGLAGAGRLEVTVSHPNCVTAHEVFGDAGGPNRRRRGCCSWLNLIRARLAGWLDPHGQHERADLLHGEVRGGEQRGG